MIERTIKFAEAMKKMTRKADKDQTIEVINRLKAEKIELEARAREITDLAKNSLQPIPELVETETMVNQEKVNEEVEPNQVYVKITGNDAVKALKANYIKWYLHY